MSKCFLFFSPKVAMSRNAKVFLQNETIFAKKGDKIFLITKFAGRELIDVANATFAWLVSHLTKNCKTAKSKLQTI